MLRRLFGYKYILNRNTGEIHLASAESCQHIISLMSNKKYITKRKMLKLLKKEFYDGCHHCLYEYHTK